MCLTNCLASFGILGFLIFLIVLCYKYMKLEHNCLRSRLLDESPFRLSDTLGVRKGRIGSKVATLRYFFISYNFLMPEDFFKWGHTFYSITFSLTKPIYSAIKAGHLCMSLLGFLDFWIYCDFCTTNDSLSRWWLNY